MEVVISVKGTHHQHPVEIDIRKILEQMGLDKERWPHEWSDETEKAAN